MSSESRKAETDRKVFAATLEILRARGAAAVTVEAVSVYSGVAKTSIYRRYADRTQMLRATLDHYLPELSQLNTDDPLLSLVSATRMLSTALERYIGSAFATVLSDPASPAAALIREKVLKPRVDAMAAFLGACRDAGRLRRDVDTDIIIDMVMGSVVMHYSRFGSFPDYWPEELVRHIWPAIASSGDWPK
jgi:AcrR family transcriptional regulator